MEGWIMFVLNFILLRNVESCSQDISLSGNSLQIHSPGYDKGKNYDVNLHCQWNIKTTSKVVVNFTNFDVEYQYLCNWDYVMVYAGKCGVMASDKFCGTRAPPNFTSEGDICIEFISDHIVTRPGFQVLIKTDKDATTSKTGINSLQTDSHVNVTTSYMYENQETTDYQFSTITEPQSFEIKSVLETPTPESENVHMQPTLTEYISLSNSKDMIMKSKDFADDTSYLSTFGQSGYSLHLDISASRTEHIASQDLHSAVITTTLLDYMPQATIQPTNLVKEVTYDFQSLTAIEASHVLLTEIYHSDNLLSHNYLSTSDISLTSHQTGLEQQNTEATSLSMPSSSPIHHIQSPGIIATNVLDKSLPSTSTASRDNFQSTERLGSEVNSTQHLNSADFTENVFTLYGSNSTSTSYAPTEKLFISYGTSSSSTSYVSTTSIFTPYCSESSTPSSDISPEKIFTFTSYGARSISTSYVSTEKLSTSYDLGSFPTSYGPSTRLFTSYGRSSTPTSHVSTEKLSTSYILSSFPTSNVPSQKLFTSYGEGSTSSSYLPTQIGTNRQLVVLSTVPDTLLSIPWSHQISHVSVKPTPHISMMSSEMDVSSIITPSPHASTSSSLFTIPVACHVTEHVLIDNYGNLTVNIPYLGEKRICTWLLLAKKNRVIDVDITQLITHTSCEKESLHVYDGLSNQTIRLWDACVPSKEDIRSTGPSMFLQLSTDGDIVLTIKYRSVKIETTCEDDFTSCSNGQCLPSEWWCDNEVDCSNGADEYNCGLCGKDEYRCGNGQCIKNILQCNGRPDCWDSSDETECVSLSDKGLHLRYGSSLLPLCGDNWNVSMGKFLCKYLSHKFSNSNIVPSTQKVFMSNQYNVNNKLMYNNLQPTTTCQSHTEVILSCSKEECGERSPSLMIPYIIGGSQSYLGQWPWTVGIRIGDYFVCGGALISGTWVVTAGHCLQNSMNIPHMISIIIGTNYKDGRNGKILRVAAIVRHPNYDYINNADIALLRLQQPVTIDDVTRPICLPHLRQSIPHDSVCYIAGWGTTDPSDKTSQYLPNTLQHAKVHLWTNTKCSRAYSTQINESMICAGLLEGGADSCQGDSGGPLMCSRDQTTWTLVGITSWGSSVCGAPNSPGVYTRITEYMSWIMSVIERDALVNNICNFETPGMCGFTDISTGQFMWTHRKAGWTIGGQPLTDNTFGTQKGNFLYADKYLVQDNKLSEAVLQVRLNKTANERCLHFAYTSYGNYVLSMKIKDVSKEKDETELWSLSFSSGTWQKAEVAVPASTNKLHLIASSVFSYWNGGVAVDDVVISNEHCTGMHLLNCQFKDGNTCGYSNSTHDIAYWTLDQSVSLSNTDWFLKYNGKSFPAGGKARLVSPVMQSEGQRCFTFHYKLCKPYANNLSILMGYVFSGEKYFGGTLWTRSVSDDNCSAWSRGTVNIPSMPLDHFIAIQVERLYLVGDVYLDDLILYNGNCLT